MPDPDAQGLEPPTQGSSGAAEDLRIVNEFALALLAQNTLPDLLWIIADKLGRVLGFEDCVIYLVEKGALVQRAAFGVKHPGSRQIKDPIEIPIGSGIVGRAAATRSLVYVPDVRKDPAYIADSFEGRSELSVPILYGDEVLGVIDSESRGVDDFDERAQAMVRWIANIAASRIASASH